MESLKVFKKIEEIKQRVLQHQTPKYFNVRGEMLLLSIIAYAFIQIIGDKHLFSDYIYDSLHDPYTVVNTTTSIVVGVIGGIARLLGEFCGMILLTSVISVVKWYFHSEKRLDNHPIIYFLRSLYLFIPFYFFVDMIQAIYIRSGYHRPERLQIFWTSIGVIIGGYLILLYIISTLKLFKKHENDNIDKP